MPPPRRLEEGEDQSGEVPNSMNATDGVMNVTGGARLKWRTPCLMKILFVSSRFSAHDTTDAGLFRMSAQSRWSAAEAAGRDAHAPISSFFFFFCA